MIIAGFISHDGFMIAAQEETLAQALSQLQDQTEVDVKQRWATALEFLQWQGSNSPTVTRELLPRSAAGGGLQGEQQVSTAADQDVAEAKEDDESANQAVPAEQQGGLPEGSSVDAQCVICAGPVKEGLADLSVQRWGDIRCRTCGNW